jgi:putative oxidoreductase
VQRLFTMFPCGWPGVGLFVLRLVAAIPLIIGGGLAARAAPQLGLQPVDFAMIGVGILLLAGLWTPVAGTLQSIIEVWIFFSGRDGANFHLLLAALGVSLVMLGPGAWSLDARLFGRKRIDIRGD